MLLQCQRIQCRNDFFFHHRHFAFARLLISQIENAFQVRFLLNRYRAVLKMINLQLTHTKNINSKHTSTMANFFVKAFFRNIGASMNSPGKRFLGLLRRESPNNLYGPASAS